MPCRGQALECFTAWIYFKQVQSAAGSERAKLEPNTKRYIRHRLSGGEGSKPIYTIQTIVADNMQHFRPVRPSHRVRRDQSYTALHLLVILPRCLRVHRLIWCSLVAEALCRAVPIVQWRCAHKKHVFGVTLATRECNRKSLPVLFGSFCGRPACQI